MNIYLSKKLVQKPKKPHYQGGFQSTKQLQTLRKSFKKHFPLLKGNECYSLKATKHNSKELCDKGIYNYCAKEYKEEAISSFSRGEITELKNEWLKNKELIKECGIKHKKEQDTIINKILKDIWKDNIVHNRDPTWILNRICTLVGRLDEPVHTAFIEKIYKKALQKCGPHYLSQYYFNQLHNKLLGYDPERYYIEYSGKEIKDSFKLTPEEERSIFPKEADNIEIVNSQDELDIIEDDS